MRRVVLSMLLVALVAGCAGTPAGGGSGSGASPVASALPPGTYTSRAFKPAVTYTLPEGWQNPDDLADHLALIPAGSQVAGIFLFRDPRAMSQDPTCPTKPEPGVGGLSTELVAWIRSRPGLVVSDLKMVTVGGLRGVEIEVAIADGWTPSCPFANGLPAVPLFVGSTGSLRWVVAGSERLRLDILDAPGGGTIVVDVDAFDGSLFADLVAAAAPIVRSFAFADR